MRYYELLYIVNPNLEDERVNGIIEEIGNEVEKHKVNIINHHIWGKKRLAYPVKNNKYGIYILLQFAADEFDFLKEIERFLILSKTVIRHQFIRLEEEPKKVEKIELDDDGSDLKDDPEDVIEDSVNEDDIDDEELEEKADEEIESEESQKSKDAEPAEDSDKAEEKEEDK